MAQRAFFYGWFLVPILWVLYGFGITPAYTGWGIFAPRIVEELELSRSQIGLAFGIFTFLYSGVGPIVGIAQGIFGIRTIMTVGFFLSAAGFYWTAQGDSPWDFYLAFGLLGGAGVGLATIIPTQTLAQHWFLKYRARVIAVIFTAGGVVGRIFPEIDRYVVREYGWREGWLLIAAVSAGLGVIAWLLVRDTPEQFGQHPDGVTESEAQARMEAVAAAGLRTNWSAGEAIRTHQFLLIVIAGVAYAVPWGVVSSHGPLHWQGIGFGGELRAALIGTMFLVSIAGRLLGMLGDWLPPQAVLTVALLLEAAGVAGVYYADAGALAYLGVCLLGLGFGAAYISVPVVFSNFFGRRAFATTSGVRILITGVFNAAGPWFAGIAFDAYGSYSIAFVVLIVLCLLGALAAAFARHPRAPEGPLDQPAEARVAA